MRSPHELSQNVRVLYVVGQRVDHGVVADLAVYVEIVAAFAYDLVASRGYPGFLAYVGTRPLEVLFVFAHLHEFAVSLQFSHLVRGKRDIFVGLLLLQFVLVFLGVFEILVSHLSV